VQVNGVAGCVQAIELFFGDCSSTTIFHEATCGLIPEKWTVEKCSSAQVKGAEGNEEKSVQ
jgi:hypothetical protein